MASTTGALLCAPPTFRCSPWTIRRPTRARIGDEIARALDEDGADAIVLGCVGMADLTALLSRGFGVPVVDGVAAAAALAGGLAGLGRSTPLGIPPSWRGSPHPSAPSRD